jgi:hypothetical protein
MSVSYDAYSALLLLVKRQGAFSLASDGMTKGLSLFTRNELRASAELLVVHGRISRVYGLSDAYELIK